MKPESIDELVDRWTAVYNRLQGDVTVNHQEHRREAMEHVYTFVLELKHVRTILKQLSENTISTPELEETPDE